MNADNYLKELTKRIEDSTARKEIMREYEDHIADCKDALMESGMSEEEAEAEAVRQMGDPASAGREMNRLYRNLIDVSMLIWVLACSIFILIATCAWKVRFGYGLNEYMFEEAPRIIFQVLGGFSLVYGFILSAWEKWNDFELFYAHAKDWGGGVKNSGVILALSVIFLPKTLFQGFLLILVIAVVQTLIRSLVILLRNRRELELLWEIGVADTAITYKGKGIFCGKCIKIKTKEEEIPPGTPIMIVSIEGSKPVVVKV